MALVERLARHERTMDSLSLRDALIIGSGRPWRWYRACRAPEYPRLRHGIGLRREAAARFSFLLSIPAVAAAAIFEIPTLLHNRDVGISVLLAGLGAASVSGYLCIRWLLHFLRDPNHVLLLIYRVALVSRFLPPFSQETGAVSALGHNDLFGRAPCG